MFPTFPVFLPSPAQVTNPILLWLLIRGGDPSSRATPNGQISILTAVHGRWIVRRCPDLGGHVALDGNTLRRSRDGDTPAGHLLAAFVPTVQAEIGQLRVDAERFRIHPEEAIRRLHSRQCET